MAQNKMIRRLQSLNRLRRMKSRVHETPQAEESSSALEVLYADFLGSQWPAPLRLFSKAQEETLAGQLAQEGLKVTLIAPWIPGLVKDPGTKPAHEPFSLTIHRQVWRGTFLIFEDHSGLKYVGVENPVLTALAGRFDPRTPGLPEWQDLTPYAFFCHAVLHYLRGHPTPILHCQDWETGLCPALLKRVFHQDPVLMTVKTVFSVNHPSRQGIFESSSFHLTGLPWESFNMHELEYHGRINLTKGGLVHADALTVNEISLLDNFCTPQGGYGLHGLYRMRRNQFRELPLSLDYERWDPESDPLLTQRYSLKSIKKKTRNKTAFLKQYHFKIPEHWPLVLILGPIPSDACEGMYTFWDVLSQLEAGSVLFAPEVPEPSPHLLQLLDVHSKRMQLHDDYSENFLHQLLGSVDILLISHPMPHTQDLHLKAMRYGVLPVLPEIMGQVEACHFRSDPGESEPGTGFLFREGDLLSLTGKLIQAINFIHDPAESLSLERCMAKRYSWKETLALATDLYRSLLPLRSVD